MPSIAVASARVLLPQGAGQKPSSRAPDSSPGVAQPGKLQPPLQGGPRGPASEMLGSILAPSCDGRRSARSKSRPPAIRRVTPARCTPERNRVQERVHDVLDAQVDDHGWIGASKNHDERQSITSERLEGPCGRPNLIPDAVRDSSNGRGWVRTSDLSRVRRRVGRAACTGFSARATGLSRLGGGSGAGPMRLDDDECGRIAPVAGNHCPGGSAVRVGAAEAAPPLIWPTGGGRPWTSRSPWSAGSGGRSGVPCRASAGSCDRPPCPPRGRC
jgi:hypothetical protein